MLFVCVALSSSVYSQEKPNVVLIFMDNYGWGEPGCYGGGILRGTSSPNIDKLADQGMKLLNFNGETSALQAEQLFLQVAMQYELAMQSEF